MLDFGRSWTRIVPLQIELDADYVKGEVMHLTEGESTQASQSWSTEEELTSPQFSRPNRCRARGDPPNARDVRSCRPWLEP